MVVGLILKSLGLEKLGLVSSESRTGLYMLYSVYLCIITQQVSDSHEWSELYSVYTRTYLYMYGVDV